MKKSTVKLFGILTLTAILAALLVTTLHQRLPFIYIYCRCYQFQGDINEGEVTLDPTKNV
jgi:cell division protein FtsL